MGYLGNLDQLVETYAFQKTVEIVVEHEKHQQHRCGKSERSLWQQASKAIAQGDCGLSVFKNSISIFIYLLNTKRIITFGFYDIILLICCPTHRCQVDTGIQQLQKTTNVEQVEAPHTQILHTYTYIYTYIYTIEIVISNF